MLDQVRQYVASATEQGRRVLTVQGVASALGLKQLGDVHDALMALVGEGTLSVQLYFSCIGCSYREELRSMPSDSHEWTCPHCDTENHRHPSQVRFNFRIRRPPGDALSPGRQPSPQQIGGTQQPWGRVADLGERRHRELMAAIGKLTTDAKDVRRDTSETLRIQRKRTFGDRFRETHPWWYLFWVVVAALIGATFWATFEWSYQGLLDRVLVLRSESGRPCGYNTSMPSAEDACTASSISPRPWPPPASRAP
jgi:hypothetical protein